MDKSQKRRTVDELHVNTSHYGTFDRGVCCGVFIDVGTTCTVVAMSPGEGATVGTGVGKSVRIVSAKQSEMVPAKESEPVLEHRSLVMLATYTRLAR